MGQHVNEGTDFCVKNYYALRSYHRVKEAFHTEFPNSATTLSDSSILWLVRKFEEVGSIQDKPWKGRSHTATTTERVEEVRKVVAQNICNIYCNDFAYGFPSFTCTTYASPCKTVIEGGLLY